MPYRVPNWASYQGYQKRGPPWVKLHVALLRKREWLKLPIEGKALLAPIWIIASENGTDGTFTDDHEALAHLACLEQSVLCAGIKSLISFGFIERDGVVALCAMESSGETEESRDRVEGEGEARVTRDIVTAPLRTVTATDISLPNGEEIDRRRQDRMQTEKRLTELLLEIRDSGADVQQAIDAIPCKVGTTPLSVTRWQLCGNFSHISDSAGGLALLSLWVDKLEHRQRAHDAPILSDSNRLTLEASARVLARIKSGQGLKEIEG